MRAIGYVRVSTELQGRSGLGLAAQLASIREAGAAEGWEVSAVFQDIESGAKDREGLQNALRSLESGDVLAIYDQGRLGRTFRALATIEDLAAAGIRVYVTSSRRFATVSLLTAVEGGMAVEERLKIRERTRAALAAKRRRGEWLGGIPLGFRLSATGRLEEDPTTMALRRRAVRLVREGRSLRVIAGLLGVPKSTLHRALRNNVRALRLSRAA